jgi:hypothetical protein
LGLPTEVGHTGGCLSSEAPLAISCWRTKGTVNVLVSKPDAEVMVDKLEQLVGEQAGKQSREGGQPWQRQ